MTMHELMDAIFGSNDKPAAGYQALPPHAHNVNLAEKALEEKAKLHPDLHWKTSIVDLMKLVGQDSSLPAREKLAKELGYPGHPGTGEPAMNEFLHKKVLERLGIHAGAK